MDKMDNLARDMIACKAAGYGCHYGAWKATQPIVHIHKDDVFAPQYKTCLHCGVEFIPKNGNQIYCGIICQRRHLYETKKLEKLKAEDGGMENETEQSQSDA